MNSIQSIPLKKKIAFLFLTVGELKQVQVWKRFFQGYDDLISIYNHSKYPDKLSEKSFLRRFHISSHIETQWANISLVRASVLLLQEALQSCDNEWFILCSETCMPIVVFSKLYNFLEKSPNVSYFCFNPSYKETKEWDRRYQRIRNKQKITPDDFMKADQWWILHRRGAQICVEYAQKYMYEFERVFASDEHYFITLLRKFRIPFINKWSTFTDFEIDHSHPIVFHQLSLRFRSYLEEKGFFFIRKVSSNFKWIE